MIVDDVVEAALARATEFGLTFPATSPLYLHRINIRLNEIYMFMADTNRNYTGRDAVLALVGQACDTNDLDPKALRITDVRIADPGTSNYAANRKVKMVSIEDPRDLAPRVFLRDGIITAYNNELLNVTSLRVYYCRVPAELTAMDDTIDLRSPFTDLLVVDLAAFLAEKSPASDAAAKQAKASFLELLDKDAKELIGTLEVHLKSFNFPESSRHGTADTGRR